jgi:hypothetical protein
MNVGDALFLGVVAALGVNHLLVRLPGWERRAWLFVLVQISNVGIASGLAGFGLPTLSGNIRVFNYVLALLFVMRAVQNNRRWSDARRAARRTADRADAARAERVREALRRGEGGPPPADPQA